MAHRKALTDDECETIIEALEFKLRDELNKCWPAGDPEIEEYEEEIKIHYRNLIAKLTRLETKQP